MINWLRKYVITEPIVFFAIFASELSFFANSNLYLQKVCRNDSSSAPDLSTPCDDEKRGSDYVTTVFNSFLIPNLLLSLIFTTFASTYSDLTRKRKVFIVMPLIGELLRQVVSMAQTIFWSWCPLSGIILDFVVVLPFGGLQTLFNFVFAYLLGKTSNKNRLTRVTLHSSMRTAGLLMGKICGGFLLHRCGFLATFAVCFVLYLLCLISALILVRDETVTEERIKIDFRHIFSLNRIRETFVLIALPKKPRKYIVSIWLLLAICSMVNFAFFGQSVVIYLYFRERFHWDEEKFGVFTCYQNGCTTVGSMLCSLLLSKWLKIHEGIVGAFAALWNSFAALGFYYAREEWQLYAALFDILRGLLMFTYLSQLGRFFTEQEFGRLNSMKMIFYTIGTTSGVPVYSKLYRSTRDTYPNAFFLLNVCLGILISVLHGITFFLSRDVRIPNQKSEKLIAELTNHK